MPRYKKLKELFARRLHEKSIEDKKSYTLLDFAEMLGAPPPSVYRWSQGHTYPQDPETRDKLADLLGPEFWIAIGAVPGDLDPNFLRLVYAANSDPNIERLLEDALAAARKYQQTKPNAQLQLTM